MRKISYEEARNNIKNGDLLFFSGTEWLSYAIRRFTKSDISHVALAVWLRFNHETTDRLCLMESTGKGVMLIPLSFAIEKYKGKIFWKPLKEDCGLCRDEILKNSLSKWGKEYPKFYQYFLIMSPTLRFLRDKLRKLDSDTSCDKYTCSEFVCSSLVESGLKWTKKPVLTTPIEVVQFDCWGQEVRLK